MILVIESSRNSAMQLLTELWVVRATHPQPDQWINLNQLGLINLERNAMKRLSYSNRCHHHDRSSHWSRIVPWGADFQQGTPMDMFCDCSIAAIEETSNKNAMEWTVLTIRLHWHLRHSWFSFFPCWQKQDPEYHFQVFVGDYILNSWVVFN